MQQTYLFFDISLLGLMSSKLVRSVLGWFIVYLVSTSSHLDWTWLVTLWTLNKSLVQCRCSMTISNSFNIHFNVKRHRTEFITRIKDYNIMKRKQNSNIDSLPGGKSMLCVLLSGRVFSPSSATPNINSDFIDNRKRRM